MINPMRTRTRELPDLDLDTTTLDDATDTDGGGRGLFGNLLWTIALPVRVAGGLVGVVVLAVIGVVRGIMIPIRLALSLTKTIIQWASDLVYALWRLVLLVVGAVVGLFRFVLAALNATVGALVRLVLRLVGGVLRSLLWIFTLGRLSGARKAKKDAEKRAEGDAVVELEE